MKERLTSSRTESQEGIKTLTPKEVYDTLFWSFYYSQGSPQLQIDIFDYIANMHPEWRIPRTQHPTLTHFPFFNSDRKKATSKALKYVAGDYHKAVEKDTNSEVDASYVKREYGKMLGELYRTLRNTRSRKPLTADAQLRLALAILERDGGYAAEGSRSRGGSSDGPFGKHTSHFIDYLILGKKVPGAAVYNEMFTSLRDVMPSLEPLAKEMIEERVERVVSRIISNRGAYDKKEVMDRLKSLLQSGAEAASA